jgi:hypothetical protein
MFVYTQLNTTNEACTFYDVQYFVDLLNNKYVLIVKK